MNYSLYRIFALLFSFLFFLSCSDKNNKKNINGIPTGGTLKILINNPVSTLDPIRILYDSDFKLASVIYEGLVEFDSDGNIRPLLAESWEKLDGGKRWIFRLRKNVYFQNDPCFKNGKGKKFTADDVLYTFKRMAKPNSLMVNPELFNDKIKGFKQFHSGAANSIEGIKILDSARIEFTLTKPYVTFLKLLATPYSFIVPHEAIEFCGKNFAKHPVGTGPFRLAQWQKWKQILLVKNQHYWGKSLKGLQLPYLDQIVFNVAAQSKLIIPDFIKGETNILVVNKLQFNELRREPGFTKKYGFLKSEKGLGLRFFGFSMSNKSTISKMKEIRKAIVFAFDKKKLFNPEKFSEHIAYSLVPQHLLSNKYKKSYTFNLNKAKRIVKNLPVYARKDTIEIFSSIKAPAVVALSEALKELGIQSKITVKKLNYYEDIISGKPDIFRVSMFPSFPDPEEFYLLFYSNSSKNINLCGYKNKQYDRLLERSMFEQDPGKRNNLFLKLEKILSEDAPALYLTHEGTKYYVYPKWIHGISLKFNIPSYKTVWMDNSNAK